jgi:putative ribosome biogenesis GTPase RsgA
LAHPNLDWSRYGNEKEERVMAEDAGGVKSGELQSSPEVRTALIRREGFGPKAVQYSVVGDKAVFEGDIVLGTVEEVEQRNSIQREVLAGTVASAVLVTRTRS